MDANLITAYNLRHNVRLQQSQNAPREKLCKRNQTKEDASIIFAKHLQIHARKFHSQHAHQILIWKKERTKEAAFHIIAPQIRAQKCQGRHAVQEKGCRLIMTMQAALQATNASRNRPFALNLQNQPALRAKALQQDMTQTNAPAMNA